MLKIFGLLLSLSYVILDVIISPEDAPLTAA